MSDKKKQGSRRKPTKKTRRESAEGKVTPPTAGDKKIIDEVNRTQRGGTPTDEERRRADEAVRRMEEALRKRGIKPEGE